jgi:hypothetical protein
MDFEGLTGRVHFENGQRKDFRLEVIELTKNGLEKVINVLFLYDLISYLQLSVILYFEMSNNLHGCCRSFACSPLVQLIEGCDRQSG